MEQQYEINHGEYGQVERGIRGKQFVRDDYARNHGEPLWYLVEYVIEDLDNVGGTLTVLRVHKIVDEFGMARIQIEPVNDEQFYQGEIALKRLFRTIGQEIG